MPYSSSFQDLSSVQLLPSIILHQQNRVHFFYQIIYPFFIPTSPLRKLFIRSIIATNHHQWVSLLNPPPPLHKNKRPYSSSSADLCSGQLLSPIIPHQQSRVFFFPYPIYIDYSVIPHQDTLYHINYNHSTSTVTVFINLPPPHIHTAAPITVHFQTKD